MEQESEIAAIGNAIVDVLCHTDGKLISQFGLQKGGMTLIDTELGEKIYDAMPERIESSGGSAANTMVGIASLGGNTAYIGKVHNDSLGYIFARDLMRAGVKFSLPKATPLSSEASHEPTARCLIMVTPDAQRTMATHLGISVHLSPQDLPLPLIASVKLLYLEGYLFDRPLAKQAFITAAKTAHEAGKKVALSLSDSFCVKRHLTEFQDLVTNHIDLLFANESEALAISETQSFEQAVASLRTKCELVAITHSEKGSVIVQKDHLYKIDAIAPKQLVDTTGAGDLYAAGVLFGFVRGYPAELMGKLGSLAASEAISHMGARPSINLSTLAGERIPEIN